jgi:hypothetical protein
MRTRSLIWHFCRLALAGILLWWDFRWFLFYAFTILLLILHHIDHLRALVRVLSIGHDAKLVAIYEHLGIPLANVLAVGERINVDLDEKQREGLDDDWRMASGGRWRW